ncbi:3'-5' exonuclease [Pseudomonas luteola]|uniref:3'-5' exonuclease n=1 Tax=Pseudomonas luteola TaxID=47886 RepID=UPI003A875DAE
MNPIHVSFDLETLSLRSDAVILSIGAVAFLEKADNTLDFYRECKTASQMGLRHIDPNTLAWWEGQSEAARRTLEHCKLPECPRLGEALVALRDWLNTLSTQGELFVWGNGSSFDVAILEHAYRQWDMQVPWKFYNVRDMRTIKDLYERKFGPLVMSRTGTHHNALDDAAYQGKGIKLMMEALNA